MKIIDVLGKPCPIPVIQAKKALAEHDITGVIVKVDNIVSVENLTKMAKGLGFDINFAQTAKDSFEVTITKSENTGHIPPQDAAAPSGLVVAIGSDAMGNGAEELGKILIKGFVYSLTELPTPPECVLFYNSGARLTANDANTIDDLKKLESKGTQILTCGTCINYYELPSKPSVGSIANMYEIVDQMTHAANIINI